MNGITSHCSHLVVPIAPTTLLVRAVLAVDFVNGGLKMLAVPERGGKCYGMSVDILSFF
jgi:hypothetical protein